MITGGRNFVVSAPAFSNDAKRLLVCTGNAVSIFSTDTGLQISELEGHDALVTSVIVVPASSPVSAVLCFCWTSSMDGTIKYWDFGVPEMMRTIDIRLPIHSMVIPSLSSRRSKGDGKLHDSFAYVYTKDVKQIKGKPSITYGQIRKCNLIKSRLVGGTTLAETAELGSIVISSTGNHIGICEKRKLRIWEIPIKDSDNVSYRKFRLHHTKSLTTLAFHPTESVVAAGDATGRVLIWRGFGRRTFSTNDNLVNQVLKKDADDRPGVRDDDDADSCTTWHWHSSEVNVLFFSSDGAYLYSGGREGVLVVWQLETGKKKFLPRIGSRILHFVNSQDPSLASISCADNQIHLLRLPSMEKIKSISGIQLPSSYPGVFFNPTDRLIAVPSENYKVQIYSLFNDREISQAQICERNHQPGDEISVKVTLVAFSLDGSSMATVDTRLPEKGIGSLVSLKFWSCCSADKNFALSTVIYEPHREAEVSCIAFRPSGHMAVSSSYGGDFRVWVNRHENRKLDQPSQSSGWACHAVGSYKKKPMAAAAFSSDGSVLAVAADKVITLWDPVRNILEAVIGDSFEPITTLSFVGKSEYLVSASRSSNPQLTASCDSKSQLTVWNMSKLSASWSYRLHVEDIACSMDDSSFAVLARSNRMESDDVKLHGEDGFILFFNVENPVPLSTWSVSKAEGGRISFVLASPEFEEEVAETKASDILAYVNGDHEYVLFNPYGKKFNKLNISRRHNLINIEETEKFGYASIYGELPSFSMRNDRTPIPIMPSEKNWKTIFSGPSHSLPPLPKLCSDFLETLLERRSAMVE